MAEQKQYQYPNFMDLFLGNFSRPAVGSGMYSGLSSYPDTGNRTIPVDICQDENYLYIFAELPGCENNISLDIDNGTSLTISGEKKTPQILNTSRRSEIQVGKFSRTLNLPLSVPNREMIAVTYENGIISIKIDKQTDRSAHFSIQLNNGT